MTSDEPSLPWCWLAHSWFCLCCNEVPQSLVDTRIRLGALEGVAGEDAPLLGLILGQGEVEERGRCSQSSVGRRNQFVSFAGMKELRAGQQGRSRRETGQGGKNALKLVLRVGNPCNGQQAGQGGGEDVEDGDIVVAEGRV